MAAPTVFISYSHDSAEHEEHALDLSNRLRGGGVDCSIDQYESSPPEGWTRWMDRQIRNSNFVVMICTETYCRRVNGEEEAGIGLGVRWEGKLIYQHLYKADANTRFIPVVFERGDVEHIPTPLGDATYYCLDADECYWDLYGRLTNQHAVERPGLGELKILEPVASRERKDDFLEARVTEPDKTFTAKLPSVSPDLFGREKEMTMLDEAWSDPGTNVVSLVAWGGVGKTALLNKWLLGMREGGYRGAELVYGWSFYSQEAREGAQASADEFIADALRWFGDPDPNAGSPWDKGERLAELVRKRNTLLLLDGLEPLQYPPGEMEGKLKDPGLQCLLRELANRNPGLCVITTRLKVDDLENYVGTSVKRVGLEHLSPEAGAQLLRNLEADGTDDELKQAVDEFGGHALALTLLGRYLAVVYEGDIRQRDKIAELTAGTKQGGHAGRVMESYEKWFDAKPELDILRIMGLFDRPVAAGAIEALRAKRGVKGLTRNLRKLSDADWQFALGSLREARLLAPEDPDRPGSLDCHPLIREHFGKKLRESNPDAWKEAHSRLYKYYKSSAEEYPDTIEDMAPLYAAVVHGCHAGRHQEALMGVYWRRIVRGEKFFSVKKLGAIGADLSALSGFFNLPWSQPVNGLTEDRKSFVLNMAGYHLRALCRLAEAVEPMQAGLVACITQEDWENAAAVASNLSELHLTIGHVSQALDYAEQSMELADRSGDDIMRKNVRTTLADALHQSGQLQEAEASFSETEEMQKEYDPQYPLLYSLPGFRYCDLLLGQGKYQEVQNRTGRTLEYRKAGWYSLLAIALDRLSLGRAHLLQAQAEGTDDFTQAADELDQAVDGLRAGRAAG